MHLSMADVAFMLGVDEQVVLHRAASGLLPGRKIGNEYHFLKTEIDEYVLRQSVRLTPAYFAQGDNSGVSLAQLLSRGGMLDQIPGDSVVDVVRYGVEVLPVFPGLDREDCIRALLERENKISTAVGGGIALPHPWCPVIADYDQEGISLLRPASPVSAAAPDGKLVHTVFLVLASNARRHLEILARLAWAISIKEMQVVLEERAPLADILQLFQSLDQVLLEGSEQ